LACERATSSSSGLPNFGVGSTVKFILDLTGGGTLSASVDGQPNHELFSDMRSWFPDYDKVGFVPAVATRRPGRVRFLGFEILEEV
jgi:hypothetical protein